ncbi:AraC family transcriptional regulator [Paenibacillus sp. TRM 82003]|nr:AraC family transcriptional regulator [Paenibacillus sp. TRM 82003]
MKETLFAPRVLREDVHPRVYAYYFKQWTGFDMDFHRHASTEIMYLIRGGCRVEVRRGGGAVDRVSLSKGEFIVIGEGVPHRLVVENSCRMLNVEFGFAPVGVSVPSMRRLAGEEKALVSLLSAEVPYAVLRDPDDVYHALKSLVLELDARGTDGGTLVHLLFSQLMIRIARLREASESERLPQAQRYVRQCTEFLRQNYDRDIQVKDAAAAVNLHPGYLHRLFRAQTGRSITDALTAIRMEKAKMLLHQTDIPIQDISEYVGVGSRQYFHALFKKFTGLTPVQFRSGSETAKWDERQTGDDI